MADSAGMMRSPGGFTPTPAFAMPSDLPPELHACDDSEADEELAARGDLQVQQEHHQQQQQRGTPAAMAALASSGGGASQAAGMGTPSPSFAGGRQVTTELDIGADGKPHVKPRRYRQHSRDAWNGRLLDFLGVPTHLTPMGMVASLFKLLIPSTATTLLYFCNQAITMMFVGQTLGTDALAYYAVGITVFNIAGLSIGLGMATGLDTLCSQAYGRDPHGVEVGILLQRGLFVCLLMSMPVMVGFYYLEPVLKMIFAPQLAAGAAVLLRASPPYLLALITNFCLQKALQAQQLPIVAVWANIASAVVCPLFNYMLTPLGLEYAAVAVALSVLVACIVEFAAAALHPRSIIFRAPWPSPVAFSSHGVVEFLQVGIPGCLSVVAEWWAFEALTAFAALQGEDVVTAFTVCMNILTFMFAVPSGLAVAAGVLCGNYLGANDPRGAKAFARLSIVVGAGLIVIVDGLLLAFGQHVFRLYTNDERVLKLMNGVLLLLAVFHFGDATQSVMQGLYRGTGKQANSARIVLVSLWLVGLPCSIYFAHHMPPLDGLLIGLLAGFAIEIPLMWFDFAFRWDWDQLADAACMSKLQEEAQRRGADALHQGETDGLLGVVVSGGTPATAAETTAGVQQRAHQRKGAAAAAGAGGVGKVDYGSTK